MDAIPDSDFLTEQEKEDAKRDTNVEFIRAYNARSFAYPKSVAVKSAKDIRAFAEDKLVAKSFTEMRCELPGAPRSTFLMVFSPDGTKVASTHGNHNIYVSDVRTGKNIKTLMGHPRTPWCIAFHPTSNQIVASGCLGGQVRIWDLSGGSEVWSSDNSTVIASLTFHPEDRLLVIATYNQLHFWDWSKPEPFATVSTATTKEKVRYVAFDPLGHKLITGISNNTTPQSRWERAQRSNLNSPSPAGILTTRHYHNASSNVAPPTPSTIVGNAQPQQQPFGNILMYNSRAQRARLTSRILAHSRAFPPRAGPDAHLYQTMFSSPNAESVPHGGQMASFAERDEFGDARSDIFGERLASSSSPSAFTPAADLRCNYASRRSATPTPARTTSTGWMVRGTNPPQDPTTTVNNTAQETSVTSRREPLSSVPDRERRISACYRNLVREYEQLVHRYLQIYRPPVMIDRGTDPMDHFDNQHAQDTATPSTSRTVNNPADIQPVCSNRPTDMRAVCEFTTTDPSVLSPLRNHEVEAAVAHTNTTDDSRPPAKITDDETDDEQTRSVGEPIGNDDSTISVMLNSVKQALTSLRSNLDENIVEKRLNNSDEQATTSNNAEENGDIEATATNQHEVNDLITNLTIISSMAVQLKTVAERLTYHKENEEKKDNKTSADDDDGAVASTSRSSPNLPEPTLNIAADIKLAKKMVDKIVQIMNTFSAASNQPSTSGENTTRKRSYATKSSRKPLLVDSSDDSSGTDESAPTKRARLNRTNIEANAAQTSSDENENDERTASATIDNASDTTSISMYNNVAADDIASASDFAERRPWNYNRELEQLVTDLLHDNNDDNSATTLCSVCGDTLGACTTTECRNTDGSRPTLERRRRFFCHRLSAFHPTRVRNQRYTSARGSYMGQEPAADEVIDFAQRTGEQGDGAMRTQYIDYAADYHPFDPPPELDTINPEHIGIGNMYSNIVQELETSLSDIRNIRSQRRLGETSDMLSSFSERLESIMTQSHAILRNLSTSIDAVPLDQNGNDSSMGAGGAQQRFSGGNTSWPAASRDGALSPAPVNGNRNAAADTHAVNADHSYPRPTHNMSPLMASLHLTVSHIWRQARLLRTQMDSIERIDRAMLELAQLRVMRQMFADLSRYFSAGTTNAEDTPRHNRASNATDTRNSSTDTTHTSTSDNTTVNSMREMMAGTRISDNGPYQTESQTTAQETSASTSASTSELREVRELRDVRELRGSGVVTSVGRARKVYPCVLVMHPRHNRRYPNGGVATMPIRRGLSRARYLGSRRNVFRQMSSQIIDVAAPGRGRNYVNLLNPDTFPSLSHRLEHYLIEHGRYICRRQRRPPTTTPSAPNAYAASTSAERLLTIRLNNCRVRMHRLLGGRTQYATNANTGPQSLVTRDGTGRFNARHTLCVMLDTLSRFMEVYGTGLVGISGSFRTYLREVIDLSRLLSEVLLLEIVDAIPPPTGMMLDPERENLSQRIHDMCSRMILTRISSQSQPLTRSLRLMRLNVRFFSQVIHQNQLLDDRFATNEQPATVRSNTPPPLQTNNAATDNSAAELPPISQLGGGIRRLMQDRGILAQYAQVRQREIQARIDDFAAQDGPEARVEEQTQRDRLARMENFVTHVGQARIELQRRREQRQQFGATPPVNLLRTPSNMSDLLYQRLEQDRGAGTDTYPRSLYLRLRSEQEVRYLHQLAMNTTEPPPSAPNNTTTSPPSSSGSPSPPLFSAATTENQRFLDSLEPTPNNQQQHAAAAQQTTTTTTTASAFVSPLRRSQQHRRLYLRSAYDHLSLEDVLRHNVEHINRDRGEPAQHATAQRTDTTLAGDNNNRSSSAERLYPMYFRNNPMWAVPEVQVNNVPVVSAGGRDPEHVVSSPAPIHRVSVNRNAHARPPPVFSRPRFLHPLYAWPGLNPYPFPEGGGGGGAPPDLLDDNATARAGDQQVYESDIIAAVTPNHRIQVWEFDRVGDGNGIIPNITNALKNIVVNECKIHNDASVDIASDGSVLVTLLPSNSYLNITNRLGIYSLEWETLGQCLYITTFDQNAVSVSLSPLSRHLVVGLASRRVSIMPSEQWTLARIFLLDGRRMAFGRLSLMKEIEQSRDTNFVMSVNCIRWLPTSGQGLVFATNTGQLRILN